MSKIFLNTVVDEEDIIEAIINIEDEKELFDFVKKLIKELDSRAESIDFTEDLVASLFEVLINSYLEFIEDDKEAEEDLRKFVASKLNPIISKAGYNFVEKKNLLKKKRKI